MVAAAFAVFPRILLIPPLRHACSGAWQATATPCGSSAQCPTGISVTYPPPRPLQCQPNHNWLHAWELLIPPAYSLGFQPQCRDSSDIFCYSLSNSPSKFPNLITVTFSWLCRLWNPQADMGVDISSGPLKPSSCLGLPGAGALQEMSLAEDISSFPEGMELCPWQGSSCSPKREKWKSKLMKNLISVLLGSYEIFSLIWFCFQNLTPLCTLPHLCNFLSTCVFMDFTLPALVFFFRKKPNPPQTRFSYSAISDHQN